MNGAPPTRLGLALRAFPTLLRVGLAEAMAYRAEMLVWMLSTTMPLVNLALWHAVARSGPIGRFGQPELVAYFLAAFIVRQLTGSWVVWEMNTEIRSGRFSLRLMRPIHPMLAYAAENLAALPLRLLMALPVAILALAWVGRGQFSHDPLVWALLGVALFGAWLIMFLSLAIIATFGFWLESALSLMYVWQALFFALSGYLFPLEFLDLRSPSATAVLRALPFYYQNGFPIELLLGQHGREAALGGLFVQWLYVAGLLLGLHLLYRAGVRRWNAYGA